MITLDASTVRLGASPASKEEAIRMVAVLLADRGHIDPAYAESMLGRERIANTFLGEGIAIPHGLLKDRELILSTGIGVVQVPGGVEWNPGETVHLVVGIAAASDEHLQILANLTQVLTDEDVVRCLSTTDDPAHVVDRLSRPPGDVIAPTGSTLEFDQLTEHVRAEVVADGAGGLHARPATAFVTVASGFAADVRVRSGDKVANGKSLASLLTLGAGPGTRLEVLTHGPDQDAALAALVQAVADGLEEEDEAGAAPALTAPTWAPAGEATTLPGIGASPGIAIGPLWHLKRRRLVVERHAKDPEVQGRALRQAIESARAELRDLHDEVKAKSGAGQAAIFRAHEAFLADPEMVGRGGPGDRRRRLGRLGVAGDDRGAHRRAVEGRRPVAGRPRGRPGGRRPARPAPPRRERRRGAAAARPPGHPHRRRPDPGAGPAVLAQPQSALAVLDGSTETLYLGLDDTDLTGAQAAQADLDTIREAEHRTRYEPAIMRDGHRIEVVANVNRGTEAAAAVLEGAEGVGLMRTEFLFLGRDAPPDEEEQYEALAEMVRALNGLPLIVRTLDIGGDKNAPYIDLPHEDNSFLGVRGIRLCLERPELFAPQLRAIYRASLLGPVLIMFPMVARIEDLDAALEHAERARLAVGAEPIDVGIMIEVPSAAMLAPDFAKRVQFFSIGTNDLTQYVLAMDRLHPALAKQADALHPAVLRTIKLVTDAAEAAGIWVGVCGGVAGEPEGALILAGLGVRELSVSVPAVAAVKARLRTVDRAAVRALADRALACSTAAQVRELRRP